ncbi:MAG: hypothetical protein WC071_05520 [Victivallaceae bacterium]
MSDNTVVIASDNNYIWGVWILIASMRKNAMTEPVMVLASNYSKTDIEVLEQFPDVKVIPHHDPSHRNPTCAKPDVMLLPDTEYVTWADCDGMFFGNCSKYLTADPEHIHIRMRSVKDNIQVFSNHYAPDEQAGIPEHILAIWRKDVGENYEPAIKTCGSACFISVHRNHRLFLKKWQNLIEKVLPNDNVGVCDKRSPAYFQTDESALNAVLCFAKDAPLPTSDFMLDKDPDAYFIHFAYQPKPWQMWSSYAAKHFDKVMALIDWSAAQGYKLPGPLPMSLNKKYKAVNLLLARFSKHYLHLLKLLHILHLHK